MSNLLTSLTTAGHSLGVYQQALDVVQNNITNSSTVGYAKQLLDMAALPFDTASGLAGGVAGRGLVSARDEYAEEEVRRQLQSLGRYEAQSQTVSSIEGLFDVSGNSGVPADLNALFQSFSAWSVSPTSDTARQSVIASATNLARDIHSLSISLSSAAQRIHTQIGSTVTQINQLATAIREANVQRQQAGAVDPGLDASLHSNLEQLAKLVDISTVSQADGTVSVILQGGSPLVVGDTQYPVSAGLTALSGATNGQAPPSSQILDWQGTDITAQIQGGQLGGLLDVRNNLLPSIIGDGVQTGSLNQFASTFADVVNGILESGSTGTQADAIKGTALFTYDRSDPTLAAGSFALNPAITPDALAPVDAAGGANGAALRLAGLANSTSGIASRTFGDFFSQIAAVVGQASLAAQTGQSAQAQVVAHTRTLRDQTSGVSLDEQAVLLLQFQRSYQAVARLLTTINGLMDTTLNLVPQ
jgi:flagellar hook-associated protein 1